MYFKKEGLRFSLVVATLGRTGSLARLLESLKLQTCQQFEVIIVDQNPPGFLTETLASFETCFSILHLRSEPGLSRARNVALPRVSGQIIAFPDDDCWYPADTLARVDQAFSLHLDWDGITGRIVDQEDANGHRWYHRASGAVNLVNLWHRAISYAIFLRRNAVQSIGAFDEDLGLGAQTRMTSTEELDYLIRLLKQDYKLHYCADILLFHRDYSHVFDDPKIAAAFGHGLSVGYVLRKYEYSLPFVLHNWARALGGTADAILHGDRLRARYYRALLRGRVLGWFLGYHPRHSWEVQLSGKSNTETDSWTWSSLKGHSGARRGKG